MKSLIALNGSCDNILKVFQLYTGATLKHGNQKLETGIWNPETAKKTSSSHMRKLFCIPYTQKN